MKINSKECIEALKNYKTSNRSEELMIELLLVKEDDDEGFVMMTEKICNELETDDIDKLGELVTKIRKELEIDD